MNPVDLFLVECRLLWSVVDLHCVRVMMSSKTFNDAKQYCDSKNGHIATPDADDYKTALKHTMMVRGGWRISGW